ncbi:LOW QUALITY PROTEIN: uncharacterized protein LOC133533041 [Cydia pomonella]|uniref:LOW QUALITY PROTEIN: uncharacterized protein LOC133533041 n=1 Tax=Cydia pomonella TaxID=82600 RepID=UPI002ADE1FAA|nr:LOW QUALITY PROTEIN: uncharacterized protein LOC133533041 [Cydia pomonella]
MNPNKKIQNTKNNQAQASPWLLCPSKSFPGKFYYFNGSTGETAWSLSDTDKILKKGPIHRVTDKTHIYPEPFEPPLDDSTNTTNSLSLKNIGNTFTHNVRPSPVFGQAVFPKYVPPDNLTPKYVWALTPMYVPSEMPQHKQMLYQITQAYESESMFVPSLNSQALKRPTFQEFQFQNSTPFQHFKETPMFDQATDFEPMVPKPKMKDEACQTFVPRLQTNITQTESDITPKSALKPSRSVKNLSLTRDVETSTLSPLSKVENINDKFSELDKNDLRFKLVAKKKKVETVVGEKTERLTDQSKTTKIREGLPPGSMLPKKRVTFALQEPGASNTSSEGVQVTDQSPGPHKEGPHWYVAVDTEAILSGLQCIDDFVKSDTSCRLLVPHAVYSELEWLSRGVSGAVCARQVLRKLNAHDNRIVVQSKPEYELSPEDSILQCCWNLLREDCHVILITINENIINKAKTINLECYTVDDIKMDECIDNEIEPVPQNDLARLKIILQNDNKKSIIVEKDTKKSENLFLQNLKEINGFSLTKPNGFNIRPSIMNIFNAETDNGNVFSEMDSSSDKLINLTTPKEKVKSVFSSEITNVKNKIVKLSITENSPVQNRTKQIMENVFRNTGLNDKIGQNPSFDLGKHCKQNASAKINIDKINQIKSVENIDAIDLDKRRLNVIENNQEKSRDTIKVSSITKLNNQLNLEEELGRFCIKNSVMETRVKRRLDEWICRLSQTMEGVLTDLLLKEKTKSKRMMPPKNPLFEVIQGTGEIFKKHANVKLVIDQFPIELISCSSNNGKLKKDLKPNEFMKLVGFSVILIEQLKEIVNCKELYEAEEMLDYLIKNIEDPKTDIELSLEKVNTPLFSRSEIEDQKTPIAFIKSRTEVLEYLKKTFCTVANETDTTHTFDAVDNEPNILITSGKNLNTLKINNTRTITVEKNTHSVPNNTQTNNESSVKLNLNNQPKVIRNVKIIDAFEERLKEHAQLELDVLDNEENDSVYTMSDITEIKSEKPDEYDVIDDLSLSKSDADTECIRAYPLARIFLIKVKSTLLRIFKFINTSIQEYQEGMSADKEADMKWKTELARNYLLKIAERLENIIARESGDGMTLKLLLIQAGDYVEDDVMMANFKQTVTKFLEQVYKLEEILQYLPSLPNAGTWKESDKTYSPFVDTSPILPSRMRNKVVQLTNMSVCNT